MILDSIHFLSQLVRDRSGLEVDGVALVGEAFGGSNPKLKVNSLQTESDKNVQKGVEQLLRGIYQGIRNPRSHEKYNDSSDDAEAIVLFINYLVRIIDRSKSPFDLDSYLERVFDPSFSESDRYAELMVAEIPLRKRWDTLIAVYRSKETRGRHWKKLRYFFRSLLNALTQEEIVSFCEVVSEELKTTQSDATVLKVLQTLPNEYWLKYEEVARIRIESKLIASIKDGKYDPDQGRSSAGGLGTWASGLEKDFVLKDELVSAIVAKLTSSDQADQDYAFQFFIGQLPQLLPVPSPYLAYILSNGLKTGDVRFYRALSFLSDWLSPPAEWRKVLGDLYDSFTEKEQDISAQLNTQITDDDVPF